MVVQTGKECFLHIIMTISKYQNAINLIVCTRDTNLHWSVVSSLKTLVILYIVMCEMKSSSAFIKTIQKSFYLNHISLTKKRLYCLWERKLLPTWTKPDTDSVAGYRTIRFWKNRTRNSGSYRFSGYPVQHYFLYVNLFTTTKLLNGVIIYIT